MLTFSKFQEHFYKEEINIKIKNYLKIDINNQKERKRKTEQEPSIIFLKPEK